MFFHLNPHPRMLCAKIGWNWLSGSGEEIFLISSMYFRFFCNNLPLKMGWVLHLNKRESPSPKDALWQVWLKMAKWFWRRRFLNFVNVFWLFRNYLPLEKGRALHLNKLESPYPRMLCAKFGWKWLSGFGEEYFWILSVYFHYFVIVCLGNSRGPFIWIPFIQGCFVPSLVEIGSVVLERKIFNFCQCILAISQLSPLGKGQGTSFE